MPSIDLSVVKSHVGNFTVGSNGSFTITVTNHTALATTANNIKVSDTLPAGLTYVSGVGAGWTCVAGAPVVCTYAPALGSLATTSFTFTVAVASAAQPTATNTAVVAFINNPVVTDVDGVSGNNTSSDPVTVAAAATALPVPATGVQAEVSTTPGSPVGPLLALFALLTGGTMLLLSRRRGSLHN